MAAVISFAASTVYAQNNTAVTSGSTASPVLLGNNAGRAANQVKPTTIYTSSSATQPVAPVISRPSGGAGFADLMNQTNATMSSNANRLADQRAAVLAQQAQQRANQMDQQAANQDPSNPKNRSTADPSVLIMHYTAPNDTGAPPPRVFHIE